MKKNRRVSIIVAVVMCAFCLSVMSQVNVASAADQPVKLRILSCWISEYSFVKYWLVPYVERLNRNSNGRLQVSWVGPEAIPPFEALKPLSAGLFDMGFTHPGYHAGEIAIGMGMDLTPGTPQQRRAAGLVEFMDEAYKKVNCKYFGMSMGNFGYHWMLKKELHKADFSGLKLRSVTVHNAFAKALGAATVQLPPAEIYSSLEKGVVDGAVWPMMGALDYKWYEVAKFQLRPGYGYMVELLLMNLDSWKRLPKDMQDFLVNETQKMENEGYEILTAKQKEEEAKLVSLGMKLNVLPPAEAEKYLNTFYDRTWAEFLFKLEPSLAPRMKVLSDQLAQKIKAK